MSSFVICCTPAHGHVMPLLVIARDLLARGHRVRFITGSKYHDRVLAAGAEHIGLPSHADVDLDAATELFPERAGLRGTAAIRFDLRHLFLLPATGQLEVLRATLEDSPADAVLTEGTFIGAGLLGLMPRDTRPPVVALGIFPLSIASRDTPPAGIGLAPMPGPIGRLRDRALTVLTQKIVFGPVMGEVDQLAIDLTTRTFEGSFLNWVANTDALVQFTVPSFEYPRSDLPPTVHFAGPLPAALSTVPRPSWWGDLDGSRPVVHVTQGTAANADLSLVLRPALDALADRDVLVVASTGGRPIEGVGPIPANARVETYLPYRELLPKVDVLISNGGYGTVQLALTHGIPLVVAGQTEDKTEVCARVGWSGAGINLRTNRPSPTRIARAVDTVLHDDRFRATAGRIGTEMRDAESLDTLSAVLATLATPDRTETSPA